MPVFSHWRARVRLSRAWDGLIPSVALREPKNSSTIVPRSRFWRPGLGLPSGGARCGSLRSPPSPSHKHRQSNYSCKKHNTGRFGNFADIDRIYPYLESQIKVGISSLVEKHPRPENRISPKPPLLVNAKIHEAVRHFPTPTIRYGHIEDAEPVARIRFSHK